MRNFILAYCSENQSVAHEMESKLGKAGFDFYHLPCLDNKAGTTLAEKINEHGSGQTVLLFISDNFLRSSNCMYQALLMLKNLHDSNRLLTVITDGQSQDPLTKKLISTPTSFERVSNVIQYMNYWQEQYLAMRKQKRELKPGEEVEFEKKLKVIRSISTEIGEFLRYLRSIDHVQYEVLKENDYELFFNATDNMGLFMEYKKNKPAVTDQPAAEKPVTDEGEANVVSHSDPDADKQKSNPKKEASSLAETPLGEEEEEVEEVEVIIDDLTEENISSTPGTSNGNGLKKKEKKEVPVQPTATADKNTLSEEETVPSESSYELLQSLFEEDEPEDEPENISEEESDGQADVPEPVHAPPVQESGKEQTEVILERADAHFDKQQIEEGLKVLRKALSRQPENTELRYCYAESLLIHKNDPAGTTDQLERLLETDPDHIRGHLLTAEIAESRRNGPVAIKHYLRVYHLHPNIPGLAYKLGSLMLNEEDQDNQKVAELFREALKADPLNVDARYQYAVLLYEELNKNNKAIRQLEETLRLDPEHAFANYDLALIYFESKDYKKASQYYQKAYEINPELRTPENDQAFQVAGQSPVATEEELKKSGATIPAPEDQKAAEAEAPAAQPPEEQMPLVLITGVTAGIGKATAELFAEKGYRLILTGRRMDKLQEMQEAFKKQYQNECQLLNFDVRNAGEAKKAIESLPAELKEIDLLINNAGLAKGYAPIHEGDIEDWETMIDTNIKGLLYLTRAVSPFMVKRGQGHIINVCSSAGHEVYPNGNVYCATKFAVDALTKSMRLDLYKHNLRVSQVSPGHVEETEFALVRFEGDHERANIYNDFNPLKSKDVAEAIWFIASRPPYVNIQDIQMFGTQQAGNNHIDRSGRKWDAE